ncbi:hypothetical protein DMC30DRAFT_407446 [Rhodotorula diobovata]|uniref:Uncharacterized protein n=1 Tax=Rhodotorula diobovata TaxID=5288 RepID=A0A5C5FJM5_9BASI|nr:hypothetical protein DMC30DRAFT_407446 [Rhodotorula diobovata]
MILAPSHCTRLAKGPSYPWHPHALEEVVRTLEEHAPVGRELVRGRPRWLGAGTGDHGLVLVLLWDPALVSTLCSGSGDLLSTSLGQLKCERAREGRARGMTRPLPSELAAAATAVGPSAAGQRAPALPSSTLTSTAPSRDARGEEAGRVEDKGWTRQKPRMPSAVPCLALTAK